MVSLSMFLSQIEFLLRYFSSWTYLPLRDRRFWPKYWPVGIFSCIAMTLSNTNKYLVLGIKNIDVIRISLYLGAPMFIRKVSNILMHNCIRINWSFRGKAYGWSGAFLLNRIYLILSHKLKECWHDSTSLYGLTGAWCFGLVGILKWRLKLL